MAAPYDQGAPMYPPPQGAPPVMNQPGYGPPPGSGYPPPTAPGYGAPPMAPGYGAPAPGYGAPAPGYGAPPPAPGYGPPQPGYGGPPMEGTQMQALNVPPGLDVLLNVDHLLVKQKWELMEALFGCEGKNKYKIKNSAGVELFKAKEDTDCCTRNICGPNRPFDMEICDMGENEVIHLYRPLRCTSCLFPCYLQVMEVYSPPGNLIGTVEQEWSVCEPKYSVKDAQGNVALTIEGPICTFSICGSDVEFKVLSPDGSTEVGKISKQWSGLLREGFTDADFFGINFPMDLDVRMKGVLLGACMLIDFNFFEKAGNQENDQIGMMD